MEAEPVENPLEVVPDGMRAQPQPLGDIRVGETFRREQRDLRLSAPKPEADPQLLGGRKSHAQPIHMERGEAGGEGAAQGHHGEQVLGGGRHGRQPTHSAVRISGVERCPKPPRLLVVEPEQVFELAQCGGRCRRARDSAHLADPPQALGQPRVLAAPFQWRHQDFDCSNECRQVHVGSLGLKSTTLFAPREVSVIRQLFSISGEIMGRTSPALVRHGTHLTA
jgi:hypothetical protein